MSRSWLVCLLAAVVVSRFTLIATAGVSTRLRIAFAGGDAISTADSFEVRVKPTDTSAEFASVHASVETDAQGVETLQTAAFTLASDATALYARVTITNGVQVSVLEASSSDVAAAANEKVQPWTAGPWAVNGTRAQMYRGGSGALSTGGSVVGYGKIDEYERTVPEMGIDYAFMNEGQRRDVYEHCHVGQGHQDDIQ